MGGTVRVLADAASSLPLHVYRHGNGRERVTSGKLVDLFDRPSAGSTQADLISSLMAHVLVYGNAFVGKFREAGEITQLDLLDPLRVRPELEHGQLRYRYTPTMGSQRMLTESDVVHVKGLWVDGLVGLSAVSQASRVLGLSDELVKHALTFFDSATPIVLPASCALALMRHSRARSARTGKAPRRRQASRRTRDRR